MNMVKGLSTLTDAGSALRILAAGSFTTLATGMPCVARGGATPTEEPRPRWLLVCGLHLH